MALAPGDKVIVDGLVNLHPGAKVRAAPHGRRKQRTRTRRAFSSTRPIFALGDRSLVLVLAGVLAIRALPIAQFPALAPPQISVTAIFPGADAQTLENTTTQIIEQQMKGLDHLRLLLLDQRILPARPRSP